MPFRSKKGKTAERLFFSIESRYGGVYPVYAEKRGSAAADFSTN